MTRIVNDLLVGSGESIDASLVPPVYRELRRLAGGHLARAGRDATLDATGLVHEAWIRLSQHDGDAFVNRRHFFRVASVTMRRILINRAEARQAQRRGGDRRRVALATDVALETPDDVLLAVDESLGRLSERDPRLGQIVELRFFGGCTVAETADVLGTSPRTIEREWALARAWLHADLADGGVA